MQISTETVTRTVGIRTKTRVKVGDLRPRSKMVFDEVL